MVLSPALVNLCRNELGIDPASYPPKELILLISAGLFQKAESIKSATQTLVSYANIIPNEGIVREENVFSEGRPKKSEHPNSVLDSALFALME